MVEDFNGTYVSAAEATQTLGITPAGGRVPAVKVANRWLLARDDVEAFAATYAGKPGRPRTKRKYTKRSPKWFS